MSATFRRTTLARVIPYRTHEIASKTRKPFQWYLLFLSIFSSSVANQSSQLRVGVNSVKTSVETPPFFAGVFHTQAPARVDCQV
jgi:hypothetical protein